MPLADPAQRQDEADRAVRAVALVGMGDDAGVEQRGGFERIFGAAIAADQHAARFRQIGRQVELRRDLVEPA